MKQSGLKNRFSEITRSAWIWWHDCMICGENSTSALHHILSPSSNLYVDGKHNESALNSCPIHNYECHIGNEAHLYKEETIKELLEKTRVALGYLEYQMNDVDREFMKIYAHLYNKDVVDLG